METKNTTCGFSSTLTPSNPAGRISALLTRREFLALITDRAMSGAFIVTLETCTVPAMRKAGNPYAGRVVKISRVNGMLNWNYENAVNAQCDREEKDADFEAYPRKWGKRLTRTPLVAHNGNLYVELKVQRSLECRYETLDGRPVEADAIAPYLSGNSASRQGVDREIILRDYAVENITAITIDGIRHEIGQYAIAALLAA